MDSKIDPVAWVDMEFLRENGDVIDAPLADEFDDDTNDEPGYSAALAAALSWEPVSDAR